MGAFLFRIAEILERAMEDFLHLNPDPLDDRHPLRTHPNASFGIMLKAIIRKEIFMQTVGLGEIEKGLRWRCFSIFDSFAATIGLFDAKVYSLCFPPITVAGMFDKHCDS